MRLDSLMFERGMVSSRSRAQALIMAGKVFVDGRCEQKAGHEVSEGADIEVRGLDHPYVGRGGVKLEAAIGRFAIDCTGLTALDVGASTGGFTDCLLQHGAGKVYALDVGFGQLDWGLRNDPRVVNLERVNARYVTPDLIPERVDIVTIDCSFISLKLVLNGILPLLAEGTRIIALVKPQFEVKRGEVGKGGVIRDPLLHERVLRELVAFAHDRDLAVQGIIPSPIKGPKGNREFFMCLLKGAAGEVPEMDRVIREALGEAEAG